MSETTVDFYRTKKEVTYNFILTIVGFAIWIGLVALIGNANFDDESFLPLLSMFLFYGGIFFAFIMLSMLAFRANAYGNMILINENQFPELHEMIVSGAKKLGMHTPPEAFLYNSNGIMNAFARQIFGKKYILLTSSLVDVNNEEQIRFIIGHELGHHVAGHLNVWASLLKLPAYVIPFLGSAYSRQREYTCDKIGYYVSKDIEKSCTAIQMLGCGCSKLNGKLNLFEFEKQELHVPPIFGFLTEIIRSHPRLTRRVIALKNTRLIE